MQTSVASESDVVTVPFCVNSVNSVFPDFLFPFPEERMRVCRGTDGPLFEQRFASN